MRHASAGGAAQLVGTYVAIGLCCRNGEGTVTALNEAFVHREVMDIKAAADYLGVSRSHLSHILAGKVSGLPAVPHIRAAAAR
jgi:hypothetical protein